MQEYKAKEDFSLLGQEKTYFFCIVMLLSFLDTKNQDLKDTFLEEKNQNQVED